jgi:hypothetical protein
VHGCCCDALTAKKLINNIAIPASRLLILNRRLSANFGVSPF